MKILYHDHKRDISIMCLTEIPVGIRRSPCFALSRYTNHGGESLVNHYQHRLESILHSREDALCDDLAACVSTHELARGEKNERADAIADYTWAQHEPAVHRFATVYGAPYANFNMSRAEWNLGSQEWSRQLREKIKASAEKDRNQVRVDIQDED